MNGNVPQDEIARLVRAALEADALGVDVSALESRVCQRLAEQGSALAAAPIVGPAPSGWNRASWPLNLAAACLLLAAGVVCYSLFSGSRVQAYDLVQSAQSALGTAIDREYQVTFEHAVLSSLDEAHLWTRGDRYRVQFIRGDRTVLWGQDEQQRIWVVGSADKALSFAPQEIPREFSAFLSYLSLDLHGVTDQILHNCELTFSEGMRNQRRGVRTINAVPKQQGNQVEFSAAQIEIDEATKSIRRLSLTRRVNGQQRGSCEFQLISEAPQPDASYRLGTYVTENATILDESKYYDRLAELFRIVREFRKKQSP